MVKENSHAQFNECGHKHNRIPLNLKPRNYCTRKPRNQPSKPKNPEEVMVRSKVACSKCSKVAGGVGCRSGFLLSCVTISLLLKQAGVKILLFSIHLLLSLDLSNSFKDSSFEI
ncbi:hypothetical protein NPIL_274421 [Nephila pilipes]|uniref:Uncharacterized protein n=1 Tax=Nephila pilipes TaxID=299642 RepID=A0A8X6IN35_NEPPI|nr:hypothetical protein NPIL_274421 [Nephila pilipes]